MTVNAKTQSTDQYNVMLQEYAYSCRIAFKPSKKKKNSKGQMSTRRLRKSFYFIEVWLVRLSSKSNHNHGFRRHLDE